MTRVIHSLWPWQGSCLATSEPNQVGGLTATASGQTTINLSWTADSTAAPNAATSYNVERSIDGLGSWSTIATGLTTNSYSDTSLSASQTRYYRVTSVNCFGGALASATANATTASSTPTAAWSLDFSSGSFSGATLTRASTGTYVDSSGYVASAATDVARLTHNSSGSRLGLLVEGSRTNLFQYSEDFGNAYWSKSQASVYDSSVTTNTVTAPDNTTTADTWDEGTQALPHPILDNSVVVTSGVTYTFTIFAKANTATVIQLGGRGTPFGSNEWANFDLSNGVLGSVGSSVTGSDATITNFGNGWYRCKLTMTAIAGGTGSAFIGFCNNDTAATRFMSYTGTSKTMYIWGAQLEADSTASSYIQTTTGSAARSADLVHVLDSSITSWGDPGALVVHFYPPGQAGTLISTDDASTAQVGIEASTTTAARAFWSSGSTATGTIGTGVQKAVHYWTGSTSKFCINGGTVQSGTNNLTIANTDFVTLGAEATDSAGVPGTFSQYANCVIRKVEFYSGTLTDANLQTITT